MQYMYNLRIPATVEVVEMVRRLAPLSVFTVCHLVNRSFAFKLLPRSRFKTKLCENKLMQTKISKQANKLQKGKNLTLAMTVNGSLFSSA